MKPSILDPNPGGDDLLALRQAIAEVAERSGIELTDHVALRGLLDGDFSSERASADEIEGRRELCTMLTLLFRLEASSSEDLGISGLRRLWRQHARTLARWRGRLAGTPEARLAAA